MRQKIASLITWLLLLVIPLLLPVESANAVEAAYVKVKSTKLRSSPSYVASGVATLNYGDPVEKLENQGGWVKVKSRSSSGFIHQSALSDKKIVVNPSQLTAASADTSDMVLAGKGFSREVEKEYAAADPTLNFRGVDQMESVSVSDKELTSFIRDGKLRQG